MLLVTAARADRLFANGQYKEGLQTLGAVVSGLHEAFGARHPDTISTSSYYAQKLLRVHGREAEAEALAREATAQAHAVLGEVHPESRLVASTLSQVLAHRGKLDEAEQVLRSVHASVTIAEGDALELQATTSNLAQILIQQGRTRDAVPLAREALRLSDEALGSRHSVTLDEMRSLGALLQELGQESEAEGLLRAELEALRETHGSAHPETLTALSRLARLIANHADDDDCAGTTARLLEAEALMREDLDASRASLGDAHIDTLAAMSSLAQLLLKRGEHDAALPLAREAMDTSGQLLGDSHAHTTLMRHLVSHAEDAMQAEARRREASLLLLASWPPPGEAWTLAGQQGVAL